MDDSRQRLSDRLVELRSRLAKRPAALAHLFSDLGLAGLAGEVLEHTGAILLLSASEFPRASYSCARAALEASQDAIYLVADARTYDRLGALLRVFDLIDTAKLRSHFRAAQEALGLGALEEPKRSGDEIIADEARKWGEHSTEGCRLLLGEWEEAKRRKPGALRHWSGLQRTELLKQVETQIPELGPFYDTQMGIYKLLSMHSHPGFRYSSRSRSRNASGTLVLSSKPTDRFVPLVVCEAATRLVLTALDRRDKFTFRAPAA